MGVATGPIGAARRVLLSRPPAIELAVAVLAAAAVLLSVFHAGHARHGDQRTALVFLALAYAPIFVRRRWPMVAAAGATVSAAGYLAADGHYWWIVPAPAIVLFHLASTGQQRVRLPVVAVGVGVALLLVPPLVSSTPWWGAGGDHELSLATFAAGCIALAAGDAARNRRSYLAEVEERVRQGERERTREAERHVEQERMRIARDLHDSVGHHIALINAQAGMAAQVFEAQPDAAHEALTHIQSESRAALDDLRETVGLLRQPDDVDAPVGPPPGFAAVDELIVGFRRSGMPVDLVVDGVPHQLPTTVDRACYRIIQESLTNVTKHSGSAPTRVLVGYDDDFVSVLVENDPSERAPRVTTGDGHGLMGMRERAHAAGGSLSAGPTPDGGYQVRAVLPLSKARRA